MQGASKEIRWLRSAIIRAEMDGNLAMLNELSQAAPGLADDTHQYLVVALTRMRKEYDVFPALRRLAAVGKPESRAEALSALRDLADPVDAPLFHLALDDDDALVRRIGVSGLAVLRGAEAHAGLVAASRSPHADIRERAARHLADGHPRLLELADDPSRRVRRRARKRLKS